MSQNLHMFDVKRYLDDNNISYRESGNNIGRGWIGINCPNCGDTSNHFGINLSSKNYSCWRCGVKGTPYGLVKIIQGFGDTKNDSRQIHEVLKRYIDAASIYVPDPRAEKLIIPDLFNPLLEDGSSDPAIDFLIKRGYSPLAYAQHFNLMWGSLVGDFKWRLIIPIYQKGELVNFTGRTVAGQRPKYKSCPNAMTNIGINQTLYGIEYANYRVPLVLVEGVFDHWRLGLNSVAMYGLNLTDAQVNLLREREPSKVIFLYDEDVLQDNEKIRAAEKSMAKIWFCDVEFVTLKHGDPDELSTDEAKQVMVDLTGKFTPVIAH